MPDPATTTAPVEDSAYRYLTAVMRLLRATAPGHAFDVRTGLFIAVRHICDQAAAVKTGQRVKANADTADELRALAVDLDNQANDRDRAEQTAIGAGLRIAAAIARQVRELAEMEIRATTPLGGRCEYEPWCYCRSTLHVSHPDLGVVPACEHHTGGSCHPTN